MNAALLLDAVRIGLSACVADRPRKHTRTDRQRKARHRACSFARARELKRRYVPLCFVDPTVYPAPRLRFDGDCWRWLRESY